MKTKIPRVPRKTDLNALQVRIGVVLVLVAALIFIGIYLNYQSVGEAISFSSRTQYYNLVRSGQLDIATLPAGVTTLYLNTSITDQQEISNYTLTLQRRDASSFNVTVKKPVEGDLIAQDILFLGGSPSFIYLTNADTLPDLEVSLNADSSLRVINLHYTLPDVSRIQFLDKEGLPYDALIHVDSGTFWNGTIIAHSSFAPRVDVTVIPIKYNESLALLPQEAVALSNSTTVNVTINTTGILAEAVVLDINATVQNQQTHAYYTLAIGNMVYALVQNGFPHMTLVQNEAERNAQVHVTFVATTELQPFALPCEFMGTADQLFADPLIKKAYTFDGGVPQVWTQGETPDDFNEIFPAKGYFVELKEAASVEISAECTIRPLPPAIVPPSFGGALRRSERLAKGWNLISLPGINARSLTTLTLDRDYKLFQCAQGYQCTELPIDAPLEPGKPYWVFAQNDHITLPLVVE